MKATVTKAFSGAKDGEHHPTQFRPGDVVEGDLAEVAMKEGWASDRPRGRRRSAAPEPAEPPDDDEQAAPEGSAPQGE